MKPLNHLMWGVRKQFDGILFGHNVDKCDWIVPAMLDVEMAVWNVTQRCRP